MTAENPKTEGDSPPNGHRNWIEAALSDYVAGMPGINMRDVRFKALREYYELCGRLKKADVRLLKMLNESLRAISDGLRSEGGS